MANGLKIRVKLGANPYGQTFICSSALCRRPFDHGGTFLRLEHAGHVVDVPVCPRCWSRGDLLEGVVDLGAHNPSYPLGLA